MKEFENIITDIVFDKNGNIARFGGKFRRLKNDMQR